MKEYKQLSLEERKEAYVMKKNGKSMSRIAQELGRAKSTITREIGRNTLDGRVGYLPDQAHNHTFERKARHGLKIDRKPELKKKVIEQLRNGWSPEIIAGRMKQQAVPFWVSHEAIYQFIYSEEGRSQGLFKLLLKARPKRGLIGGRKPRSAIPDRVSIHDRPSHIATREEFGHFEGDLTFFVDNQSTNIGVITERKTRFTLLFKNWSKHTTLVIQGLFNKIAKLPDFARKSITFDNGLEFARHTLLKNCLKMQAYFCDKHAPWQKGQVEQMNVMLHRYLPKNSDIKEVLDVQIELIQELLNNRP